MTLDEKSFDQLLKTNNIYFSGSGILKLKTLVENKNALYADGKTLTASMAELSWNKFSKGLFSDAFKCSALYLKEFYTYVPQS